MACRLYSSEECKDGKSNLVSSHPVRSLTVGLREGSVAAGCHEMSVSQMILLTRLNSLYSLCRFTGKQGVDMTGNIYRIFSSLR